MKISIDIKRFKFYLWVALAWFIALDVFQSRIGNGNLLAQDSK